MKASRNRRNRNRNTPNPDKPGKFSINSGKSPEMKSADRWLKLRTCRNHYEKPVLGLPILGTLAHFRHFKKAQSVTLRSIEK